MTPVPVGALSPAIAAFGFPSVHTLPGDVVPTAPSTMLVDECTREGTLGLLGEAVRSGALVLAADARATLELQLVRQARHDLSVERTLLRVSDSLTCSAVEWRVVGSPALARTAYPRPELRSLDRAQILVNPADADRASSIARSVGVPGDAGAVGTLPYEPSDLFAPPYRFPLGGYELATLPMPQRLLVLCAGGASATPPLAHLRDVAEVLIREEPHAVDVLLLARAWGCESELASTLVATWKALGITEVPPLVGWARAR